MKGDLDFLRDKATYPENGVIYEGDYYRGIPFLEYLHHEEIPNGKVYDIRDYGAIGDGVTLCTDAINDALKDARDNAGGTVLVEGGMYCCGTIKIYNNTNLFISSSSALVASKDLSRYTDAFVIMENGNNSSISGGGKIIGNGEYFVYPPLKRPRLEPMEKIKLPPVLYDPMGYPVDSIRYEIRSRIRYAEDRYGNGLPKIKRPLYMIWLHNCTNSSVHNIDLEGAMDWNLCIDGCDGIHVENLVINGNRHVANTDGIDVMGSSNVDVKHCFISCADDGLVVKAPKGHEHDGINASEDVEMRGTHHVHFEDCTVLTVANSFKIGTETYYDISDIIVENCHFMLPDIYPGTCSGIAVESADGSNVSNVMVRNITMDNVTCPIFICLNKRNKFGYEDDVDEEKRFLGGSIDNIVIEKIKAINAEVPSIITGYRMEDGVTGKDLGNIIIKDIDISYRDDVEEINILPQIHESVTDYPENNSFGDVPAYGLFIRHAPSVALENITITPRSMNTRENIAIVE